LIVLETSALVAILLNEDIAATLNKALVDAQQVLLPAHVIVEATLVMMGRRGTAGLAALDAFLAQLGATVVPFTEAHALAAREAFLNYGKGRHPAALNFGDCMSYAVAKVAGRGLLFAGGDFALTDVGVA
jgi:ribonuclease VapC